ncbi:MAG: hypothetical protein ISS47_06810 [Candidatus Omnitrophica bacterium]|nr:hypothetical protein [Candidatus Omnitrophota bacterium]
MHEISLDELNTGVEVVVQKVNLLDIGHADWRVKILDLIFKTLRVVILNQISINLI